MVRHQFHAVGEVNLQVCNQSIVFEVVDCDAMSLIGLQGLMSLDVVRLFGTTLVEDDVVSEILMSSMALIVLKGNTS